MSDSISETTGCCLALLLVASFGASAIADETQYQQAASARQRTIDTLRSYAARHRVIASDGSGARISVAVSAPLGLDQSNAGRCVWGAFLVGR